MGEVLLLLCRMEGELFCGEAQHVIMYYLLKVVLPKRGLIRRLGGRFLGREKTEKGEESFVFSWR